MKHFTVLLFALLAFAQIAAQPTLSPKKVAMPKKETFLIKPFATGPQFSKGLHGYDVVTLKDCELTTEVGAPQLPVKYMHFLIPPGKEVVSIKVKKKSQTLTGQYNIMPAQPPCYFCEDWRPLPFVDPDPVPYSQRYYPENIAQVIHHGYFDGRARIVTIAVYPLQYSAARKKLVYHEALSFRFTFRDTGHAGQPIVVRQRSPELQEKYDALLISLIDNTNSKYIHLYYPPPEENDPKAVVLDYVIIAPEEYLKPEDNYFGPFISWKKAKGLNVYTKSLEEIRREYPPETGDNVVPGDQGIKDLAGSVRQYLYKQYENGLVYALLVGDNTIFPVRYGCATLSNYLEQPVDMLHSGYIVPTDLYFADFNGKWNLDGDEYYGEPYVWDHPTWGDNPDYFCEIFVGRLLVPHARLDGGNQLTNWLDKLITYETNPVNGDDYYLHKALYTSSEGMAGLDYIDDQISLLLSNEMSVNDVVENPINGDLGSPTGAEVLSLLNEGYGLTSFNNHGDVHTIAVSATGDNEYPKHWLFSLDEYLPSTDVYEDGNGLDNLEANSKYFINYSISCDIGAYDWETSERVCMARTFTTLLQHKGGPAIIANTRWGTAQTANMLKNFLNVIFGEERNSYSQTPVANIGIALAGGKHLTWGSLESYSLNLFGDPEMPIWTQNPDEMTLKLQPGLVSVTVTDSRSQETLRGAQVHFWDEEENNTELTLTNENGLATSRIKFTHVCVTRENYLPVIQKIAPDSFDPLRMINVIDEITR